MKAEMILAIMGRRETADSQIWNNNYWLKTVQRPVPPDTMEPGGPGPRSLVLPEGLACTGAMIPRESKEPRPSDLVSTEPLVLAELPDSGLVQLDYAVFRA